MNEIWWDFLENLVLGNFSYRPIPSCPVSVISSQMAISLMLGTNHHFSQHSDFLDPKCPNPNFVSNGEPPIRDD
jgi:hypothetical protein